MFDRMDLKVRLDTDNDIRRIVDRFRLQHCTRGAKTFYESSEYGRFEGIHLKIEHNILKMVCSIHKFFFKSAMGILDNSGSFTISQARAALRTLFNDVEVFVPSDRMGDVMGDLQGRRAMIMGMSSEKGFEKLVAKVPLKEMSSYSTALSSLTGGRASFIMKFSSYELVPTDVQDKLMKDFEAKQTEE